MYTLPFLPSKPNQKAPHRHQTHRLSCMQLENGAPTQTGYAWGIISYYGDECIHLLELLKALTRGGSCFQVFTCSLLPSGSVVLKLLFFSWRSWDCLVHGMCKLVHDKCDDVLNTHLLLQASPRWIVSQCSQIIPSHHCSSFSLLWSSCLHWKPVTVVLPGYCQRSL